MKVYSAHIIGFALFLAVSACANGARTEAEQVAEAMDRFRKAPNNGKPDQLAQLRAVKCSANDVCQARDACLASAEATAKSLVLKSEVEVALAAIEAGTLTRDSAEAQSLSAKLDESAKLLDEGFHRLPACDGHVQALKRTYAF